MKDNPNWALTVCLEHLVIPRATLGYHNCSGGGVLLASRGCRSGMLPSLLQ